MSDKILNCAECDELFPDYFEGELDAERLALVEAHATTCARCQGLIRDVDDLRATAVNLPVLAPSRDLWAGIESRIQPQVVSIAQRQQGIHLSRRMIGIAAAALVVISSSVTYVATNSSLRHVKKQPVRVVTNPTDVPDLGATNDIAPAAPAPSVEEPKIEPAAQQEGGSEVKSQAPVRSGTRRPSSYGTSRSGGANAVAVKNSPVTAAEASLAPEIAQLQGVLRQRRAQLDPSTVKVVEDNLALIDAAAKQARAALMRDPASSFLTEQLDNALQKKVELLRTVALLPSRS
jgi:hypothetical protein